MNLRSLVLAGALLVVVTGVASAGIKSPLPLSAAPTAPASDRDQTKTLPASREAVLLYNKGLYQESAEKFEEVLSHQPNNYRAAYMLGMSYLNRSRWESARDAFRRSLEMNPDRYTQAHVYNGIAYSYEGIQQTRMAHHYYHLACHSNKANAYAQAGARRTEYHQRHEPQQGPIVKNGSKSSKSAG